MFEGLPDTNKVAQVPHKRKGRMVKGSPEALAWAEKMRKLRAAKKKSGGAVSAIFNTLTPAQAIIADSMPVSDAAVGKGRKRKSKKTGGLSMPSLNSIMEVAKPVAKELGKVALDKGVDYLKKKISGAGISGGRAKRAEIVKKVMKERNLKMIEASKYVKTHGLY